MRRRLLVLAVGTTVVVLVALSVPLLVGYAGGKAVRLHETRLAAATRFAVIAAASANGALVPGLTPDLVRYTEVTGARVWVLDPEGAVLTSSGPDLPVGVPSLAGAVRTALDGAPTSPPHAIWPWDDDDLVAATPVGRDAQVLGAVVVIDDTGPTRHDVAVRMALLTAGAIGLLALLGWAVAIPLVGWIVRPVVDLEQRAHRLAEGRPHAPACLEGPPELRRLADAFNRMAARSSTPSSSSGTWSPTCLTSWPTRSPPCDCDWRVCGADAPEGTTRPSPWCSPRPTGWHVRWTVS